MEPETKIEKQWIYKGRNCVIIRRVTPAKEYFTGYCETILKLPFFKLTNMVGIHGGLNYGPVKLLPVSFPESLFYGFSCDHPGDETDRKLQDIEWVKTETEALCDQILEREKLNSFFCKDEFTDNEKLAVIAAAVGKNDKNMRMKPCAFCKSIDYQLDDGYAVIFRDSGSTPINSFSLSTPVLLITCRNCGHMAQFSKAALGLLSKDDLKLQK